MSSVLSGNPEKVQEPVLNTLVVTRGNVQNTMNYHSINVTKNSTTLHIIVRPQFDDSVDEFDVLLQVSGLVRAVKHQMSMFCLLPIAAT